MNLPWLLRVGLLVSGVVHSSFAQTTRPAADSAPSLDSLAALDLVMPPELVSGKPVAGMRFKEWLPAYRGTDVYHVVYLPTDWQPGKGCPVIVEYAGNTPADDPDKSIGRPEGCKLGFGLTAGRGCLWICMPYVATDRVSYQSQWWGDVSATVDYCKQAVPHVCETYGGNQKHVFLAGFSRGSIACNFIGLHDDEIAQLWCGFICHSHYDGARLWNYEGSDEVSAAVRLARLGNRPQWISHEKSSKTNIGDTRDFLHRHLPQGRFKLVELPFADHSPLWVYRDLPARRELREWYRSVISEVSPEPKDAPRDGT